MKLINVSNCNPEYYENPTASWVKVWIAVILVVAGILNYFLLARKRQHNKIVEEFKSESKEKRRKGMMYAIFYLVVSLGIPLYIFFFTTPK
jgi:hypothetical protein